MATRAESRSAPRISLSRERVLRAAVDVADRGGIESLTMRRLADELGAEAMSLYYHVANKDAVLDGVVDVIGEEINDVVDRIGVSAAGASWKAAVRQRILAARQVLLRHPWAPRLLESRTGMSPALVRYHDALIGLMRAGGLSYDLIHHGMHALGSRALGFTQELFDPSDDGGDDPSTALEGIAEQVPHIAGMLSEIAHDDPDSTLGWCDDQTEFEFALDLILDGLERKHEASKAAL